MALFATAEELRIEGINYCNQGFYEKAIKSFTRAIDKNDFESITLLADAKWKYGARTEAVNFLLGYVDDESEIPNKIKIDILNELKMYDKENFSTYMEKAAYLGDLMSMRYVFECKKENARDEAAVWVERILSHDEVEPKLVYEVLNSFEKQLRPYCLVKRNEKSIYFLQNEKVGNYDRREILRRLLACPETPEWRKGEIYFQLGRMDLVRYYVMENNKKYEQYRMDAPDVFSYFIQAMKYKYHAAYYYLSLLYAWGINRDIDVTTAKYYMDLLFEDGRKMEESPLYETMMYEDILALAWDIWYKTQLNENVRNLDSDIIGHKIFNERVHKEISMVNHRYDEWDWTSSFSKPEKGERKMEHKIIVFNGGSSNCKRTIAEYYFKVLKTLYQLSNDSTLCDIKTIDIDMYSGLGNKISYLKDLISSSESKKEYKFIYFDQPYRINDPEGNNYYHIIMNVLLHEVIDSTNKVLFLAGDGDAIVDELKALNIAEYFYVDDIIDFKGYSENEAMEILRHNGFLNLDEFGDAVCSEVKRIIQNRNMQYQTNINYDEIREISRALNNAYSSLPKAYRRDVRNYDKAFKTIESRLRIEKISDSTMEAAIQELEGLVGLKNIKEEVYKIIDTVKINNIRKERGLQPMFRSINMVFSGNPGTGKTTVARLMGTIFKQLGVLEKGHLVEKSRGDLVSQYFGATAGKTKEILKQSLNGVLFIDEAYSLTNNKNGSSKDYGQEALEEILKFMSDKEGQVVVIVAGYKKEMQEFINSNPGLESRFNTKIEFEDYTEEELYEIFERLCQKNDFDIEEGSKPYIIEHFTKAIAEKGINFGNARFVNQYFTEVTRQRSKELANRIDDIYHFSDSELRLLPVELFRNLQIKK